MAVFFSYAEDDALTFLDSSDERVRVHYSVSGPNAAALEDLDENGEPDFVSLVAEVGERALGLYGDALGFESLSTTRHLTFLMMAAHRR